MFENLVSSRLALRLRRLPTAAATLIVATLLCCALSACSAGYILRAAYEQGRILARREKISSVIADATTPESDREKLIIVLQAREFAISLGLDPGQSFTRYSALDRDTLAWVVLGSKRDAFVPYLWWFPIVGSVPYKGFFERDEAEAQAAKLMAKGYETWVRGTDAISTLGWFNDPLLSTTLRQGPVRLVNTVIHESTHATLWVKDHVDFNESLANFVGSNGAVAFFEQRGDSEYLAEAQKESENTRQIALLLDKLYSDLNEVYESNRPTEIKISERQVVFARDTADLERRHPDRKMLKTINNAEIMQLRLYLRGLDDFGRLFAGCNRDFTCFMKQIRQIADAVDKDRSVDPFKLLREMI